MSASQLLENSQPGLHTTLSDIQSPLQLLAVQRWTNIMVSDSTLRVSGIYSIAICISGIKL